MSQKLGSSLIQQASERERSSLRWAPPGQLFKISEVLICLACQVFSSWPCHGWDLCAGSQQLDSFISKKEQNHREAGRFAHTPLIRSKRPRTQSLIWLFLLHQFSVISTQLKHISFQTYFDPWGKMKVEELIHPFWFRDFSVNCGADSIYRGHNGPNMKDYRVFNDSLYILPSSFECKVEKISYTRWKYQLHLLWNYHKTDFKDIFKR